MAWITGVHFPMAAEVFLFATTSRPALGLTSLFPKGIEGSFPRVNQLGCAADCSPPSSAKVKNVCGSTSTPPYVYMVPCLIEHREIFTFHIIESVSG